MASVCGDGYHKNNELRYYSYNKTINFRLYREEEKENYVQVPLYRTTLGDVNDCVRRCTAKNAPNDDMQR